MKCFSAALLSILTVSSLAYQPNKAPRSSHKVTQTAASVAASAVLSAMLLAEPALASSTAAQISLENLPPNSIAVLIRDLPVVGNLLSGTYTKVPDGSIRNPAVVIQSPKNKVEAIRSILTNGHLEFDVSGVIKTHMDVDVSAEQPGVAMIRVASDLIPRLPFKNLAAKSTIVLTGGKESAWNMVTNMGSGETYYYNEKTGVTQYEYPGKF